LPCTSPEANRAFDEALSTAALHPERTNHINDVLFDRNGSTAAAYTKYHLFPSEKKKFDAGPYAPATFALGDGRVFGMIICYEVNQNHHL
jgi:predicted amidohydrolase